MKNLTTSIYTFEKLIEGNYFYVDKTEYIWDLIKEPYGIYFLSRPRRFGKSLTLSTLKAVFQGKKNLFEGLALENKSYDWKEYPVIHLDLGESPASSAKELDEALKEAVNNAAEEYGVTLTGSTASLMFSELIRALKNQEKVVILIDEYDKPILDNATAKNIEEIRRVLEDFYSVVKATEPYQRFVLLTGVSKFSKVSVFSKLNNLTDITMDTRYATMLGYKQDELEANFSEHIDRVVEEQGIDRKELLKQLKEWYNGYRFEDNAETVYNPVSIGKFFESGGKFKNYWFETGTPSFLLKLAKEQQFDFEEAISEPVSELAFASYEINRLKPLALFVQTGYLTISGTVKEDNDLFYLLGFPNREVEAAFEAYLLDEYADVDKERVEVYAAEMARMLRTGDIDAFMEKMKYFFYNIPNDIHIAKEKYYQTIFFIVFRLIGLRIEAECSTNIGYIDAVTQTDKHIYIFEFKLNKTPDMALKQIHEKGYHRQYMNSGKEVILIGANFSTESRNIEGWKTEVLKSC
jgi:hypothetical protein